MGQDDVAGDMAGAPGPGFVGQLEELRLLPSTDTDFTHGSRAWWSSVGALRRGIQGVRFIGVGHGIAWR